MPSDFYQQIRAVISDARKQVQRAVNSAMVQAYWQIGRLIVEQEQQGESRAAYGMQMLEQLSERLTAEFGKGVDVTNLRNMRRFFEAFPIRDAVRLELSWTHYRILLRIKDEQARIWYANEAISENWSSRALERQIGTLYYERLGLILCSEHNHTVAQYSVLKDNQQLFASEYLTVLPSEEELQEQLRYQRQRVELQIRKQQIALCC